MNDDTRRPAHVRPLAKQRDTDYSPNVPQWRNIAPCADNPDLPTSDVTEVRKAFTRICKDCPVRVQCAQAAIDGREEFHVWGGVDLSSATRSEGGKALARSAGLIAGSCGGARWTAEEEALLGHYSDRIVGWLTGRSTDAVKKYRLRAERKAKK